ncbi:MAG: hypothetical protein JZU47_13835 [Prolixibacteraceae bacterium]|nr:hypothetical protein [Prolixibacteraceae bacterium]
MKKEKTDYRKLLVSESKNNDNGLPSYPTYPEGEDIYNIYLEESDINPEDINQKKEYGKRIKAGRRDLTEFGDEFPDLDLDVPGSELDDDMENIGSEDEENNYYSLGGDDHLDPEERLED